MDLVTLVVILRKHITEAVAHTFLTKHSPLRLWCLQSSYLRAVELLLMRFIIFDRKTNYLLSEMYYFLKWNKYKLSLSLSFMFPNLKFLTLWEAAKSLCEENLGWDQEMWTSILRLVFKWEWMGERLFAGLHFCFPYRKWQLWVPSQGMLPRPGIRGSLLRH